MPLTVAHLTMEGITIFMSVSTLYGIWRDSKMAFKLVFGVLIVRFVLSVTAWSLICFFMYNFEIEFDLTDWITIESTEKACHDWYIFENINIFFRHFGSLQNAVIVEFNQ